MFFVMHDLSIYILCTLGYVCIPVHPMCLHLQEFGLKRAATVIGYVPTKTTGKPLPKSNGDNIYTDQMVPGYTGIYTVTGLMAENSI